MMTMLVNSVNLTAGYDKATAGNEHSKSHTLDSIFLFLQKLKKWVVLKIYLPEEKLYNVGLELNKKKSIDDGTGCDCRFFIPQLSCNNTDTILDKGGVTKNIIIWHRLLEGDFVEVSPWLVGMVRPMGSQYLNAHNKPMSDVLSCNTNIQIGGRCQVFYSTLYVSKNNQKEDVEK